MDMGVERAPTSAKLSALITVVETEDDIMLEKEDVDLKTRELQFGISRCHVENVLRVLANLVSDAYRA